MWLKINKTKKFKLSICIFVIFSLFFSIPLFSDDEIKEPEKTETEETNLQKNSSSNEQIACPEDSCSRIIFENEKQSAKELESLLDKNAGKILIDLRKKNLKLSDDDLDSIVGYLKGVLKNDGKVSVEPFYMATREMGLDLPVFKDVVGLGIGIFFRIRNFFKYKVMANYHGKVLYHPKKHNIMLIFFVNRSYGDVCDTVFAKCNEVEYIDDESFDLSLSNALKESLETRTNVKVNFRQTAISLPDTKVELDTLKNLNKSLRIYKWLVVCKETKKTPMAKERFIPISAAVTAIDYSIKIYDAVKTYMMYKPAMQMKAEVYYSGKSMGGNVNSIVFVPNDSPNIVEQK